jgi:predicted RNA methylase
MNTNKFHFAGKLPDDQPLFRRYFLRLFKSKARKETEARHTDAIPPDVLKKKVIELGRGKKVSILRLSYDGTAEDHPVAVKIIDIGNDHFTGKVVNVDREVSESQEKKLIFVKGGGGTIDFQFADGDILSIQEDIDEEIIEERSIDEIREVLEALDLNEDVTISYYDKDKGGVIRTWKHLTLR